MGLVKATLQNISIAGQEAIPVKFNPTEYSVTTNMQYADINVPGLRVPLVQFVRGEARTLSLELFLDRSDTGENIEGDLAELRTYVEIDEELHAPPVCRFKWGETQFDGVVTGFTEKFTMFDVNGSILRARVTISMKSYQAAELQYRELNYQSPDRTKTLVVEEGERLDLIAAREYGDPALWPVLARANGINRPRLLRAGDVLMLPPL